MQIRKNIHLVTWMFNQIKEERLVILFSVVLGMLKIAASLCFIWISKEMIDKAVSGTFDDICLYVALLVSVLLFEILFSASHSYIDVQLGIRVRSQLMRDTFFKVLNSVWNGKERWHTGDVVNRIEEDVKLVSNAMCNVFPGIVITLVQFLAAFLFLSYIDLRLAWIIIFIMPLFLVASFFVARVMKRLTMEIRETDGRIQSVIQESLQKRIVIKALMRVGYVYDKLSDTQNTFIKQSTKRNRFGVISRMAVMAGFGAGYLIAFVWGVVNLQQGLITFGMMSAFLQLVGMVQSPTADLSRKIPRIIHSLASAERLLELYSSEQEHLEDFSSIPVSGSYGGIYFDNVTFGYSDSDRKILSGFSYDFTPGSSTAIIGETGSGKSTMMRLMLGLIIPESGSVYIYSDNGERLLASSRTRLDVIYVPQGNSLLSGTIRENLVAANTSVTEDDIRKAVYIAAAEFIYGLPDGLETICGEGGEGLSEGQAQRISIARALLGKGHIMLLDEFTSALDAETENKLMDRLTQETTGKTIVFITHRKEIADRCTNVLNMNEVYKK